MDRCHRIGQLRPVLVFRLATAHSVEGKMLKRASEKMALERLVIKKGVFKEVVDQVGATQAAGLWVGRLLMPGVQGRDSGAGHAVHNRTVRSRKLHY